MPAETPQDIWMGTWVTQDLHHPPGPSVGELGDLRAPQVDTCVLAAEPALKYLGSAEQNQTAQAQNRCLGTPQTEETLESHA